jgi:hypothetical protein
MKFAILATALFGTVFAQNGYTIPNTGSATLPSDPSGAVTVVPATLPDVKVPTFPIPNLFTLQAGSSNGQVAANNVNRGIRGAQIELSTPVRSVESLFSRVPSKGELDKLADDGDVAGIQKTLQVLASDDSIPCGTKVSYLLDVLGTVKAAIARKNLAADELQAIIDGAKAEIARLQGEIARVQKARDALALPDLLKRVNDLVGQLQTFFDRINAVKAQIPPEEARITGFLRKIEAELAMITLSLPKPTP